MSLILMRRMSPESVVQNNVVYPYYVELALGVPAGSPNSVESEVDLVFACLSENRGLRIDVSLRSGLIGGRPCRGCRLEFPESNKPLTGSRRFPGDLSRGLSYQDPILR